MSDDFSYTLGHVKFYPYEKEGADKVLAMPKGRGTKSFGVVFTR